MESRDRLVAGVPPSFFLPLPPACIMILSGLPWSWIRGGVNPCPAKSCGRRWPGSQGPTVGWQWLAEEFAIFCGMRGLSAASDRLFDGGSGAAGTNSISGGRFVPAATLRPPLNKAANQLSNRCKLLPCLPHPTRKGPQGCYRIPLLPCRSLRHYRPGPYLLTRMFADLTLRAVWVSR
jgi:hypothetical protein